jgi:RpiR family carbohydrate utilization transcriptional regulator
LLTQAKKIAFFGLGSSAAVAHDAMNKFSALTCSNLFDDIVLQRMSCMNCSDDDVIVLISHTGRTKSLVELAQLARENDAMVIALTSPGTPLARKPRWQLPSVYRKILTFICPWSLDLLN